MLVVLMRLSCDAAECVNLQRLDLSAEWMRRDDTDGRYKELYDDIKKKRPTNMLYTGTSASRRHDATL